MGYTIGMPSLKLSNVKGKGSKHCGNFRKVVKEALKERQGVDTDINPNLAVNNKYIGFDTAQDLIAYSDKHIEAINAWRAEHGERPCDRRRLRDDTVVMCATVIKPPAAMMLQLTTEQQHNFLQDSLEIFGDFIGKENVKAAAFHFDERVPHLHILWEPMTDKYRICAKEMHSLKFFGQLNRDMPKRLREKGWSMVDDCQAYDKAEEEKKRLEMGEDKYKEYRKAQRKNNGKNSRQYKHEVEQQIEQEQQHLICVKNERKSEEQAAIQARQRRQANEQLSEVLQAQISEQEQTQINLRKKAQKAYNIVLQAREETKKAKEDIVLQQMDLEKQKSLFNKSVLIQNEQLQQQLAEIEKIKSDYIRIKEEFLIYIKDEIKKVKSETQREAIEQRIKDNIRTRAELTAELDEYVNSITHKSKERGFTL